jgi:hypothetical protein
MWEEKQTKERKSLGKGKETYSQSDKKKPSPKIIYRDWEKMEYIT